MIEPMPISLPTPSRDDDVLIVRPGLEIPASEFEFTFMRSSGPGGQNVNKVSTKARLRWPVETTESLPLAVKERFTKRYHRRLTNEGDLVLTSQRYRDQTKNVSDCLLKLRELIDSVIDVPKPRKKTKPTRGSKERRLKEKRSRAQKKTAAKSPVFLSSKPLTHSSSRSCSLGDSVLKSAKTQTVQKKRGFPQAAGFHKLLRGN